MRKFLTALASMAMFAAPMAAPAAALGDVQLPDHVEEEYLEVFEGHDIPEEHWAPLLDTIRSGELLDADSGADPVSVTRVFRDGRLGNRLEYADHSVAFITIADDTMTPEDVSTNTNCGLVHVPWQWNTYTGCMLELDTISFRFTFLTDYQIRTDEPSMITRAYSPVVHRAYLHTVSDRDTQIVRPISDAFNRAHARMSMSLSNNLTGGQRTVFFNMFLTSDARMFVSTNL